jgi:hypothetical protein
MSVCRLARGNLKHGPAGGSIIAGSGGMGLSTDSESPGDRRVPHRFFAIVTRPLTFHS